VGLRQTINGFVWRQEFSLRMWLRSAIFQKKSWASKTPTHGRGRTPRPRSRDAAMISTLISRCWAAIVSAWLQLRQDPPGTAPQTCPRPTRVDTALDEASLHSLAEAISRKIARDRAVMGQGRLLGPVVSQEVCHFTIITLTFTAQVV
jgi:hypothetical protein